MFKPDIVVQWCVHCDYPLFRKFIEKYRDRFGKVILYPSRQHGSVDLEAFAKENFDVTWVEPVEIDYGVEDWRQAETIPCLAHVTSDWVWFMEQDFFTDDWNRLFKEIDKAVEQDYDMIGLWNPTHYPYVHPCFLLMKTELLEETNKDFSAHPDINGCDHFAMLTRDAENLGAKIFKFEEQWPYLMHLGGLTYPFQNWKGNGKDHFGVKSPQAYYVYLNEARKADVPQSPEYLARSAEIEKELKKRYPEVNLEDNEWLKCYRI